MGNVRLGTKAKMGFAHASLSGRVTFAKRCKSNQKRFGWAWATCPSGPLRCSDQAAVAQLASLRHTLPRIRLILRFSAASTAIGLGGN